MPRQARSHPLVRTAQLRRSANCAVWAAGIALTLLPSLVAIIAGLAVCAVCGLISQAISTGYVTLTAQEGRSSAVGLYATIFSAPAAASERS